MCAPYLEKSKLTFLLWFLKRSSVHVTASLVNKILTNFNNFSTAETGKKCTKQGMHFLIYYLKKVLLMT